MAELAVNNLVKIIIGLVVVVAVVAGLFLAFKNNIIEFLKSIFSSAG